MNCVTDVVWWVIICLYPKNSNVIFKKNMLFLKFKGKTTVLCILASQNCDGTNKNGKDAQRQNMCIFLRYQEFVSKIVLKIRRKFTNFKIL